MSLIPTRSLTLARLRTTACEAFARGAKRGRICGGEHLGKLCRERLPDLRVPASLVARDDPALSIDHEDVRLIGRSEASRPFAIGIGDRRPAPLVAVDEGATLVGRVGDVEAEKGELRVTLLELCVGDRLALAGASPRRPDVHEHLLSTEIGQRSLLTVERRSRDRRCDRPHGRVLWRSRLGRRRCRRRNRLVVRGAASTSGDGERTKGQQQRERPHQPSVASTTVRKPSFRIS